MYKIYLFHMRTFKTERIEFQADDAEARKVKNSNRATFRTWSQAAVSL